MEQSTAHLVIINAIVVWIFMTSAFVIAWARKRLDTVDIAWGLGFVIVAWSVALQASTHRSLLVAVLVSVWGLRLSNHIFERARRKGEDPRYQALSSKWKGNLWLRAYGSIFLLQGLLIVIISLSIVFVARAGIPGTGWLNWLGVIIWMIGFAFEALADHQLATFLRQKDHPRVMDRGLWGYSRHPNYFGELTQWWGIGIIACQASFGWIGLLGPLMLTVLIVFISGIPPIENRHKGDPDYQKYYERVSKLIPWFPKNTATEA